MKRATNEKEKGDMKYAKVNVNLTQFGIQNTTMLIHTIARKIVTRCDHITNVLNTIRSFY